MSFSADECAVEKSNATADLWADWLLHARHGGDPAFARFVQRDVERIRQRVLDGAEPAPGMTLIDVGAGDGVVAFGAIARVGPSLRVVLTDISAPLLDHARETATALGVRGQCEFVQGSAEKLDWLPDAAADIVTTRASLAYVADKAAALREFHRVLKPGGRISLAEPIMQDDAFEACALGKMVAAQPDHEDIAFLKLLHRWKAAQYPSTEALIWKSPITNFSERDLLRFAKHAGFVEIHLELHIDHQMTTAPGCEHPADWEVFLSVSPHPWAPSLRQILAEKFTAEERTLFERLMRPQVESSTWTYTGVVAYLTAQKRT
jgi:ubiquinone/menaquinone biosynthesis C-methylase UbiE